MDIRIIAFGMLLILALLFVWVKFYIPKEKLQNKVESDYFNIIVKFKNNNCSLDEVITIAKEFAIIKKINKENLLKLLENDTQEKIDNDKLL